MSDLTTLEGLAGTPLSAPQIDAILAQIDLDILNLVRDGKLSALPYGMAGPAGRTADRAENLRALLEARRHYAELQARSPGWAVTQAVPQPAD